jgi:KDO2-lipid IV(A) lauroyltransferase
MSVVRTRGARFLVTIHEPIDLERTGDRARDLEAAVTRINAFIEARIRERPAEWLWSHRRWPLDCYRQEPSPA